MEARLEAFFPFWKQLTPAQRESLEAAVTLREAPRGTILHNGSEDCVGLLLVLKGQLRAYILSDEGREITLYRLLERDICLFSASCMMPSIQFELVVSAEKDTQFLHLPTAAYQQVMQESAPVANYTSELIASRFSDVMWLVDQLLYKKLDSRLAAFLLEESDLDGARELKITHEEIARHLGSAREVITRMLQYFQSEGWVSLSRGTVALTDEEALRQAAAQSLR